MSSNTPDTHLPDSGSPTLLFVLLHGEGQTPTHMQPLALALRSQYPQCAVHCLSAPAGYWYSLEGANNDNHPARVAQALPDFIAQLRTLTAHYQLPWQNLALGGFSQGAILALEAVQAEPHLAGRVLAFGGAYATPPTQAPAEVSIHLLHGLLDPVLPYPDQVNAARALVAFGADVTLDVLPNIGHDLHPDLVAKAMEQLRTFVPARLWKAAMAAAKEQGLAKE